MSENTDHENGGTFVFDDTIDINAGNTKWVAVQGGIPDWKGEGQIWMETDDDPPTRKVWDETNTAWMDERAQWYMTGAKRYKDPEVSDDIVATNGTLSIQRDTTNSDDFLYWKANGVWYGLLAA